MNSPEIERTRNARKTMHSQKSASISEGKNERKLERLSFVLSKTKEEINKHHLPVQWFNEWVVEGEDKGGINSGQPAAGNHQYDDSNEAAFFYY